MVYLALHQTTSLSLSTMLSSIFDTPLPSFSWPSTFLSLAALLFISSITKSYVSVLNLGPPPLGYLALLSFLVSSVPSTPPSPTPSLAPPMPSCLVNLSIQPDNTPWPTPLQLRLLPLTHRSMFRSPEHRLPLHLPFPIVVFSIPTVSPLFSTQVQIGLLSTMPNFYALFLQPMVV